MWTSHPERLERARRLIRHGLPEMPDMTRCDPTTTPARPLPAALASTPPSWLQSAQNVFKEKFGTSPSASSDYSPTGKRTPAWIKTAQEDVLVYEFGSIRAAAWEGDKDAFDRAVDSLRADREFRDKHRLLAGVADTLVATRVPKLLVHVRAFLAKE